MPGAADFGQLAGELVRQHDRQRHQLRRFVAGVAEHQALIAGAAGIHTHGDVGRLALDGIEDAAGLAVEADSGVGVADVGDGLARELRNVDITGGRDFAGYDANAGGDQHFASHAAVRILFENSIENGIGNLVRNLIGVALGHGFRRE